MGEKTVETTLYYKNDNGEYTKIGTSDIQENVIMLSDYPSFPIKTGAWSGRENKRRAIESLNKRIKE